jgi:hypothetical protein
MAQVGLNDLHFAILTEDTKDALTYEPTEAMVGAINATISPTPSISSSLLSFNSTVSASALNIDFILLSTLNPSPPNPKAYLASFQWNTRLSQTYLHFLLLYLRP